MHTALIFGVVSLAACATDGELEDDVDYGETTSALRVGGAVSGSCSTAIVRGLSKQIADEVDCMAPASLSRFAATTRIRLTSNAVLPYLHPRAKADLQDAAVGHTLRINSAYRTVAQQYLLYRWFRAGRCGIAAAALPGRSNHETGRALDLANWSSRVGVMANHHWAHDVPGDPVHFDNTRSPDKRGLDVRAFQRLWNRNHPGDKIAVDGAYGPQTAARLKRAPAKGFKKGAQCRAIERGADVLVIDGPDRVYQGERARYAITIANNDDATWPASSRLVVGGGLASELYDAATWRSPTELGTLGVDIPGGGGEGELVIEVQAPEVTEEHDAHLPLALVGDDGVVRGTFDLAVQVTMDPAASGTSADQDDVNDLDDDGADEMSADEDGVVDVEGGCSAGGGASGWGVLVLGGALALRRRRRERDASPRERAS